MNEYEYEPVPGLPGHLPPGERLLWQGSPDWRGVARRILHVRAVTLYFGVLLAWRLASGWHDGESARALLVGCLWVSMLGAGTLLFLLWVARLIARGTIYSISTRRVVMRFGIALPVSLNIPLRRVRSAGICLYPDGTGDIPLQLGNDDHVAYLHLWPHARPWRLRHAEPMLRAVPRAATAAQILGEALSA